MSDTDTIRARLAEAVAGDYELLGELGQGGMATVFLARDLSLDRKVAIKVMAPQLVAVDGMAERFLMEARIAAALSHPHIIPIHAVRRKGDLLYFVMKYVAGRSLDVVLAEAGPLGANSVRAILTQVGAALEAAHRKGVVHRDIKPANILIDEHGDAVVADFGIARIAEQPGKTQAGQTVGTPQYMSPEQCGGEALTGAADQYSLGVVAYELLTGAPPFTGDGLMQVVWKMVHEKIAPLDTARPETRGAFATTVHRMLGKSPTERWPSVAEAIAALPPLSLGPDDPTRLELIALASGTLRNARASSAQTVVSGTVTPVGLPTSASAIAGLSTTSGAIVALPVVELSHAPVASIRLPLPAATITIDDELRLAPDVRDADGAIIGDASLAWTSSDPGVAAVDDRGRVLALRSGRASITVQSGEALATLTLVVTRAGPRSLALTPRPATLEVGDRLPISLVTGEAEGLLPHPRLAAWTTNAPGIATVDALGVVTARAEGAAEVTARVAGASATIGFRVTKAVISAVNVTSPSPRVAIGALLRLAAEPSNTKGHPLPGLPIRWEVSDPRIAAITPEGVLTALRSGQVLVAAKVGGRVGTTRVTVAAGA